MRASPLKAVAQSHARSERNANATQSSPPPLHSTTTDVPALVDLSLLFKFGVKGEGAAKWLADAQLNVPTSPNSYVRTPGNGIGFLARLGTNEFLLVDHHEAFVRQLSRDLGQGAEDVYPVVRQDAEIALVGARAREVLLQTCSVNFDGVDISSRAVVMTSMVGVSVVVVPWRIEREAAYRIFCDPSYAPYLWQTLQGVVDDLRSNGAA